MTISPETLKSLDMLVDGVNIRSRSEAIESVLSRYLASARTAVFLGGGKPERISIDNVLKPLVDVNGKALIVHNIERLKKAGFTRIVFIGSSTVIGECFKVLGNGSKYGVSITYIEEHNALGNAKTIQLAEHLLKTPFLVLPVDNFFDFDLNYLLKIHSNTEAAVTLAVQAGRGSEPGMVEMIGNKIISYDEKPKKPETFLTATFIGMYDPLVFSYIPRGDVKCTLQTDVFPKLIKDDVLYGCIVPGFYINIKTKGDIREVKKFAKK